MVRHVNKSQEKQTGFQCSQSGFLHLDDIVLLLYETLQRGIGSAKEKKKETLCFASQQWV